MKILLLAPQPFYQERGTPIAVRLAAEVLASRTEDEVTLLTYEEGTEVSIPNVVQKRVRTFPKISGIRPGFSLKKLYTDIFFFFAVVNELWSNRKEPYDLIHAVEESVFMALLVKLFTSTPYIYDMDSSLSLQMIERFPWLSLLSLGFRFLENIAIRHSLAVVPVCDALAVLAESGGAKRTLILRDISLLDFQEENKSSPNLREEAALPNDATVILYVGNLEQYQGIDLLVEGFAQIHESNQDAYLVIIGGSETHIEHYQTRLKELGVPDARAKLIGPRPVSHLSDYLKQADILTSPRTLGNNTPMKVYSYIHSGTPLLATKLPTHTQVLDSSVAQLADPNAEDFGRALEELLRSEEKRKTLSKAARELAEEKYTFEVFEKRLNELYDSVGSSLALPRERSFQSDS